MHCGALLALIGALDLGEKQAFGLQASAVCVLQTEC